MIKKLIVLQLFLFFIPFFIFPQTVSQKYNEAMVAYTAEQFAQANRLFEEFFKDYKLTDELYASAKYYSADALLKLGRKNEAAIGFEYLVSNFIWTNFRYKALYNLGLIYYNSKNYELARARLRQLLNEYPETEFTGSALYWIGESYSEQNKLPEAISFLEDAVADKRNNKFADYSIYTLATVYEKTGDYESAVRNYDRLLTEYRNSPLAVSAQIRIGICYFKLKDYQSSILELKNPILSNLPEDLYSESLYLLALSNYRVQQYADAEKSYSEIIERFPNSKLFRDAHYGLAWTFFQQKKYSDAFRFFDFLSNGKDSIAVKSFYWKGESKRYAGQNREAFEIYREFLEKFPGHYLQDDVQYQIGALYFNNKNNDLAARYLITSSGAQDITVRAKSLTLLGEIELSKNQYAAARNYFEPALRISEGSDDIRHRALFGLGISLFNLNEFKQARETLLRVDSGNIGFETQKLNFFLGESYFAEGNYSEAIKRYNNSLGNDESINLQSLYGKAYSYFNSGDYQNAALQFADFVKRYPRNSRTLDARLRLADSYYGSKNFAMASNIYRDLFQGGSSEVSTPYANYQYAQALYKSGRVNEAITEFTQLQNKFPNSEYAEGSLFTIAWIYFQQGNFNESISRYKVLQSKYPKTSLDPIINYSIGDAYFNLAKYDSAISYYENVITNYPGSNYIFDAVNGIQFSYVAMDSPERAISFIDEFITRNPNFKNADQIFFKKGEIHYGLRQYDNSQRSYREFIARYPQSSLVPDAYYWIGKSAQNLNQFEEAIFNFDRVFREFKTSETAAAAILEIGNIHRATGNYQDAISAYDLGIKDLNRSPRMPEILFNKGNTLVQMDKFREAFEVFDEVAMYYPNTIFADKSRFEMGLIELALGRHENSDVLFRSLADKRGDDLGAKAQYYLGVSLFEQGKTTEAITSLVRVRTVYSNYDEWLTKSYLLLGACYEKMNDNEQAKEMYRAVIQKHRGNAFGQEAQERLRRLK
jgi:TolA-binding protein